MNFNKVRGRAEEVTARDGRLEAWHRVYLLDEQLALFFIALHGYVTVLYGVQLHQPG